MRRPLGLDRAAKRVRWRAMERARSRELHRHPLADRPPEDRCPRHPSTELVFTTEDGVAYQSCAQCGTRPIPRVRGVA